jgi:hypothetical protein
MSFGIELRIISLIPVFRLSLRCGVAYPDLASLCLCVPCVLGGEDHSAACSNEARRAAGSRSPSSRSGIY